MRAVFPQVFVWNFAKVKISISRWPIWPPCENDVAWTAEHIPETNLCMIYCTDWKSLSELKSASFSADAPDCKEILVCVRLWLRSFVRASSQQGARLQNVSIKTPLFCNTHARTYAHAHTHSLVSSSTLPQDPVLSCIINSLSVCSHTTEQSTKRQSSNINLSIYINSLTPPDELQKPEDALASARLLRVCFFLSHPLPRPPPAAPPTSSSLHCGQCPKSWPR